DAVEVGARAVGAEVFARGFREVVGEGGVPRVIDLDVHVRVDRLDRSQVDRRLIARARHDRGPGASSSGSCGTVSPTDCRSPTASAKPETRSSYDHPPSRYAVATGSGC